MKGMSRTFSPLRKFSLDRSPALAKASPILFKRSTPQRHQDQRPNEDLHEYWNTAHDLDVQDCRILSDDIVRKLAEGCSQSQHDRDRVGRQGNDDRDANSDRDELDDLAVGLIRQEVVNE